MWYIYAKDPDTGVTRRLDEGPWDNKEDAQRFADHEVGVPFELLEPNLFCYEGSDRRNPSAVRLVLSADDKAAFTSLPRGPGVKGAVVTDMPTGKKWRVKWAPCGCKCYCAAAAYAVK